MMLKMLVVMMMPVQLLLGLLPLQLLLIKIVLLKLMPLKMLLGMKKVQLVLMAENASGDVGSTGVAAPGDTGETG